MIQFHKIEEEYTYYMLIELDNNIIERTHTYYLVFISLVREKNLLHIYYADK